MFMLLYVAIVLTIYIATFKNEFTEEHIAKVMPVVIAILAVFVLVVILGLAGWGAK